jgi:colicin import membrane protein
MTDLFLLKNRELLPMFENKRSYKNIPIAYRQAFLFALTLHFALLMLFLIHLHFARDELAAPPSVDIVQATLINREPAVEKSTVQSPPTKKPPVQKLAPPVETPPPAEPELAQKKIEPQTKNPPDAVTPAQETEKAKLLAKVKEEALQKEKMAIEQERQLVKAQEKKLAAEKQQRIEKEQQQKKEQALAKQRQKEIEKLLQQDIASSKPAPSAAARNANKAVKSSETAAQVDNSEVDRYKALVISAISHRWIVPENLSKGLTCHLKVRVAPGGVVMDVKLVKSSGNVGLDQSAQTAVYKASPLPVPKEVILFNQFREFNLLVRPEGILAE